MIREPRHFDFSQSPRLAVPVDRLLWLRFVQWCGRYGEVPYDHINHLLESYLDCHTEGESNGQTSER